MPSIQIIGLIAFVVGIIIIPVVDQLFFYSAFNFKGSSQSTQREGQANCTENATSEAAEIGSNSRIEVTRTAIDRPATQEDFDRFNEPDIKLIKKL